MSKEPLPLDLRERVVAAVLGGMSRRQAAERFGVSAASAVRWCRRQKEAGSPAPTNVAATAGRLESMRTSS